MKSLYRSGVFLLKSVLIGSLALVLLSWGKFGHEHINRAAVMSLPAAMQRFYYNHIDFITIEANLPDVRKYTLKDSAEFPRHHIHLESFGNIDSIPKASKDAMKKYDAKFLSVHGTLPWYIQDMVAKLTEAFKHQHKSDILLLSADLAHYIGDAYMPLHTSENHNGTLTNQKGIHAFFEGQLPELFGGTYNYNAGEVKYIADLQQETWNIIKSSNRKADSLLSVDRDMTRVFGSDDIWEKDAAGKIKTNMYGDPVHTLKYAEAYHARLNGMVEKQLRAAIASTASYWYTAWVNAGKPDLDNLDSRELTQRNSQNLFKDIDLFKRGKLFGIKSEKEFN